LCGFADLTKRFEKRGMRVDFIVDLIKGFPPLDDPQIKQILELSLCRMQGKTRFKHNLSLIKSPACMGQKKL
jgi:hypothetical protein